MAKEYISLRNLKYLLKEVHNISELTQYESFQDYDWEACEMMLDAAHQLANAYLFPHFTVMDREEPELENGVLRVHSEVTRVVEAMAEGGWIGAGAPVEWGGMQLPRMLSIASASIFHAANNGVMGYTGLTSGAAHLILSFGSEELKNTYVPNMFGGKWQGTMALTEPQAGSSLSDVKTSATPLGEGVFRIKGQKIFISAGDHDKMDNVVHLMLARIDGAPKGTRGISLFVVPKYRLDAAGNAIPNDVQTIGIYHKMGQKATPTVHLLMGEKDDCQGYLVGEENRGLPYMFQMMNDARIDVGLIAASIASAAYCASLEYAQERPQGRRLNDRDLNQDQTLIIHHPDVRRMLLFQKAVVEGALSLLVACARYQDVAHSAAGEEKELASLLLDLLTPVAKTYPSEMGIQSVSQGMQVLGGAGFVNDFPLEQLYRDIRITAIYEGTTGIQSQDLLGRKVMMQEGRALKALFAEIERSLEAADDYEEMQPYTAILRQKMQDLESVTRHLMGIAVTGDLERFLSDANLYMEFFGIIVVGWQWIKQATVAKRAILSGQHQGEGLRFYHSKLLTMKFFFAYEMPKTLGLKVRLMDTEVLTIVREEDVVV